MKKPFPKFDSDEDVEAFLDKANLDEYDLTTGALPRDEWFARYERFAKALALGWHSGWKPSSVRASGGHLLPKGEGDGRASVPYPIRFAMK